MKEQEYLLKLQMLEQEAGQFEEQIQIINQQINELKLLKENIAKFEQSNENEIFSEFGKGIYFKSKIDKKEFLIDVGSKILVPKTVNEIDEIINEQIKKFESIKPEIESRVRDINLELDKIVNQIQEETSKENKGDSKNQDKKAEKGKRK